MERSRAIGELRSGICGLFAPDGGLSAGSGEDSDRNGDSHDRAWVPSNPQMGYRRRSGGGGDNQSGVEFMVSLESPSPAFGMSPYNISYLRLVLPLAGTVGVLSLAHVFMSDFRSGWLVVGFSLIAGYIAFICLAVGFGLDSDDRIILNAMWSRIGGKLPLGGDGI